MMQSRSFLPGAGRPTKYYDALKKTGAKVSSHAWVLLRYAQDLTRKLKKQEFQPDPHWYEQRAAYAVPPPNPTPAPSASSKVPAASGGRGGAGAVFAAIGKILLGSSDAPCPAPRTFSGHIVEHHKRHLHYI